MKDVRYPINLNDYRNWHHSVEGKVKIQYTSDMGNQLEGLKIKTPFEISFQVYKPTRRRLDKGNIIAVTTKYFLDALVVWECIPDDNDDYVKDEHTYPTIYDKNNGRIEIHVKEL